MSDEDRVRKILERVERKAGIPGLADTLASRLSLPDLQTLLNEVYRQRAQDLSPRDLARQFRQNRFAGLAQVDPGTAMDFDRFAFSLLPEGFEAVELSPVSPLGTCSVLGPVDQRNVLATIRNTEVCSDPTSVLALECAERRRPRIGDKRRRAEPVKLAASQRVVRTQAFDGPAMFGHFRLLAMCTAGVDGGSYRFEVESVLEHLDFYLRLLGRSQEVGLSASSLRVRLLGIEPQLMELLEPRTRELMATKHPRARLEVEPYDETQSYYGGCRFQVLAEDDAGEEYFLADGGFTDWTQQLLSNRKERLLISGIGSERLLACFQAAEEGP